MKKFLFSCFVLLLLAGCGTNPTDKNAEMPYLSSQHTRIEGQHVFINNSPLDEEFADFIQSFTPDTLPVTYGELLPPQGINSPLKVVSIKPVDFVALGYSGKIAEYERTEFYLMLYFDHPAGLFWKRDNLGKYGAVNEGGYNDFYILFTQVKEEEIDHIIKITGKTATLYKNFEVLYTGDNLQDFIVSPEGEVYLMEAELDDYYRYHNAIITKEGQEIARIASGIVQLLGFDGEGKLLYANSINDEAYEEAYSDGEYFLYKEPAILIDSRTGNFLVSASTYTVQPWEEGFVIGRQYTERPNDIKEGKATITQEILDEVAKQELTILKFYRLIDQQHFEEAYQMLTGNQLSFEEFTQQWKNLTLIDVNTIQTPLLFFNAYPTTPSPYLTHIGNFNQFQALLFMRNADQNIWIGNQTLQVIDNEKILIQQSDIDTAEKYSGFIVRSQRNLLTYLYYHLIASQRFEEAYNLQYTHSQSLEQFAETYKDVLGIVVREFQEYEEDGSYTSDDLYKADGKTQILLDFISYDGSVERYFATKEIINGKVKHISSKPTTKSCEICPGYGYKPVIYLYPEEETEIKVGLHLNGNLTVTYPEISPEGQREVTAQPDGTLQNKTDGKEYSYLFREGQMNEPREITEGFAVKNEDTVDFLQEKLAYLGLTPREYNEFIVYRRPLMKQNKRNLISFIDEAYTTQATLTITPKPDSMQRVFMVFQGLDEPIDIPEQTLKPFERSGFSVIEWGGSQIF